MIFPLFNSVIVIIEIATLLLVVATINILKHGPASPSVIVQKVNTLTPLIRKLITILDQKKRSFDRALDELVDEQGEWYAEMVITSALAKLYKHNARALYTTSSSEGGGESGGKGSEESGSGESSGEGSGEDSSGEGGGEGGESGESGEGGGSGSGSEDSSGSGSEDSGSSESSEDVAASRVAKKKAAIKARGRAAAPSKTRKRSKALLSSSDDS